MAIILFFNHDCVFADTTRRRIYISILTLLYTRFTTMYATSGRNYTMEVFLFIFSLLVLLFVLISNLTKINKTTEDNRIAAIHQRTTDIVVVSVVFTYLGIIHKYRYIMSLSRGLRERSVVGRPSSLATVFLLLFF